MDNRLPSPAGDASRPASLLNLLAGIWLIISSWVLGFSGVPVAVGNAVILGIAVLVLAAIRLGTTGTNGISWLNLILGIWLIISPFVLGFSGAAGAMGNAVVLGILVGLFSLWAGLANQTTAASPR
jgi:hypothetical protein